LAGATHRLGLSAEAIAALDKIKDANQNNAGLWNRYTIIYRDMGDLTKALDSAKRAVDLDKTVPEYWLAYIDLSAKESADFVKNLYQQALQNTENNINIITAYAAFLEKIGDKQGAIEQWQKATQSNPQKKAEYEMEIKRLQGK
jgi:tetratricopeptide (TPR) repeat protein